MKAAGERVKGVYVIPNFQKPTWDILSLRRRRQLIQLVEKCDLIIFEYGPYGELRFEGRRLASLKSLDENDRVINLRSLCTTLNPGMRLGWVCGEKEAIHQMVVAKQFADAAANTSAQYIQLEISDRDF